MGSCIYLRIAFAGIAGVCFMSNRVRDTIKTTEYAAGYIVSVHVVFFLLF